MLHRIVILLLLLCSSAYAGGGLDLYFVRHAQTLANAKGVTNTHTSSTFTDEGLAQIDTLTAALQGFHFDAILVSPTERTLLTIAPFLKASGQKGMVWPELTECCWQKERGDVASGQLVTSGEVRLTPEHAPLFGFRDSEGSKLYANRSYPDGVAQVNRAAELIRQRYGNSGKTLLVVAHYHSGQVLLAKLLDVERDTLPGLENARITRLKQGADGKFSIVSINVEPE
jgi:broad specificity phosphatase PhoE